MPSSRPTNRRRATFSAPIIAAAMVTSCLAASAEERAAFEVVGCDTLVALRLLSLGATPSMTSAEPSAGQPGCRRIPKDDLGEVKQRAMIGRTPFECLALRGSETCAWVAP